ncbi:GyrI-like domain-containing protein [Daejeonella sp.]|jgi:AraC family transcriptional regulator|uniref:GyrI-like domain-containing protein n=1 Tax=Daejeonella sp. TaxID=2805397 RepID=UPI003783C30B
MSPIIEFINEKKLVGKRMTMSYADYKVGELWANFMPRRKEITNKLTNDLISLVLYSSTHFVDFKATNEFERWATVEVASFDNVPDVMETFILSSGLYAVFHYTGLSTSISSFYQNIFTVWLPNSDYNLDSRAHFEVLGEKYKNNDPSSEEDIWIPIKAK